MDLEELKLFLRVDGTDDDTTITSLQLAAETYLINAGITKNYTNDLYKLAVKLLVIHWFENRESYVNLRTAKLDFSLQTIIYSLRYTNPGVII